MKKQSSAYHKLGKFKISPSGIEHLARAIEAEGSERLLTLSSINITTKHSSFKYETVEELRSDRAWEKKIQSFSMQFREMDGYGAHASRAITISGGGDGDNYIRVRGDEESWVVGMGKVVQEMMRKYEVWYKHLVAYWLVLVIYPVIIMLLFFYFTSVELVIPRTEVLEDGSEKLVGDYNYEFYAILIAAFPVFVLAYRVPVGSRIIEDPSSEKMGLRWLIFGSFIGIAGLIATLVSLFL